MSTPQNIQEIIENIRSATRYEGPLAALKLIDAALGACSEANSPKEYAALLLEKGKLLWRLDRTAEAISTYEHSAALDPEGPAQLLLDHSRAIMDFFNPDLLNP